MKELLLLIATITLVGCARPGDHPISSNCAWSEQDSHSVELSKISDRRHLRFDAATAEDMAIRWADMHFGHQPDWWQKQNECKQTLFQGIAKHHGVDVGIVRQYGEERDVVVDAAVILSFGVAYVLVTLIFTRRIRRRFLGEDFNYWIMTLTLAAGISLVAVLVGILGSIVIETVRLNSGHLSYRMDRIPFRRYWATLYVCGFIVFGLVALMRSRAKLRIDQSPG